jgi:hypothetical protein
MATTVRTVLTVQAFQSTLNFGPWSFDNFNSYAEFFGADLVIGATSRAQIIGGTAPVVSYITTVQSLLLWTPTTDVRVGLHGVDSQTAGFTLTAGEVILMGEVSMNALNLYNPDSAACSVLVAVGGT